jgi:MFS family permease
MLTGFYRVWALAGGVGPIVGGAFTSKVTWRWCFYINLPISGLGFAVLVFVLKLHNPRTPLKAGLAAIDWLGVLTIVGGTLMVLLGLVMGGVSFPWNSPTIICLIVFGFVVAAIFVVIEWKVAKYPIIPLRLFKDRSNVAAFLVCSCHGFVFISGAYYLPLYFQAVLGASPLLSGTYVLPFSISLAVASTITGIIVKKTGKYKPAIIVGLVLMTLGFGLFIDFGPTANWAKIVIFQLIAGIGLGPNFQAPLIALQSTVEPRDIASITGTFAFIRQLATAISVVIGGVVFQNEMGKQHDALQASLGSQTADLLTAGNAGASVGIVASLPGNQGDVARGAYWNALKTMYYMYVAFAASGIPISFLIRSRSLSKEHQEHKTGLAGMQDERKRSKQAAVAGSGSEEEKGHGALGDEKVGDGRRDADTAAAKEEL